MAYHKRLPPRYIRYSENAMLIRFSAVMFHLCRLYGKYMLYIERIVYIEIMQTHRENPHPNVSLYIPYLKFRYNKSIVCMCVLFGTKHHHHHHTVATSSHPRRFSQLYNFEIYMCVYLATKLCVHSRTHTHRVKVILYTLHFEVYWKLCVHMFFYIYNIHIIHTYTLYTYVYI